MDLNGDSIQCNDRRAESLGESSAAVGGSDVIPLWRSCRHDVITTTVGKSIEKASIYVQPPLLISIRTCPQTPRKTNLSFDINEEKEYLDRACSRLRFFLFTMPNTSESCSNLRSC